MSEPPGMRPWSSQPGRAEAVEPPFRADPAPNDSFFDQAAPAGPRFDQAGPAEPMFGQSPPAEPMFGQTPPAEPLFDQTSRAGSRFDQPGRVEPPFDQPGRAGSLFDQAAPAGPRFDQAGPAGPMFGQTPPAEPFFDQTSRAEPRFGQPGSSDPLFDQARTEPPRYQQPAPAFPDLSWPTEAPAEPPAEAPSRIPSGRGLPDLLGDVPDPLGDADDPAGLFDDWKTTDRQPLFDDPDLAGPPQARNEQPARGRKPLFADALDDGPNAGPSPYGRFDLDEPDGNTGPAAIDTALALSPIPHAGEGDLTRASRVPPRERRNVAPEPPAKSTRRKGMPGWFGVLIGLGSAIAIAALDLRLTETLTVFFGLCFIITAFGVAAGIRRDHLFTAGVSPPLYALGAISVIAVVAPQSLVRGETSPLVASLSGLAGQWWSIVAATTIALGTCALRVAIEGPVDEDDEEYDETEHDDRDGGGRTPSRPQRPPRPTGGPPNRPARPPQRQPREDPSAARAAKRR